MQKRKVNPDNGASAVIELPAGTSGAAALDLQLAAWSHLWTGAAEASETAGKHHLVRKRLLSWLERCIGREASGIVSAQAEQLSLEVSTPLLIALLGRRAARELSRHVLRDL